ncbi:MAG TPA: aminotransferase class I/II-fold pyridoxal phosphate-dependent enzyme [Terracidiphilus sp.]|nr:aminotransferase class I/II-fold pyridoxal phosphate-dependent enzyme [Terracidiphilus sp.]
MPPRHDVDPVPGLLAHATEALQDQFAALPEFTPAHPSATDTDAMLRVLEQAARRLGNNYPYFHPLYAGQMLKPPHPVARAAYALAMTLNPNNHALDGGRASSAMEIEAVAHIAAMFGWPHPFLGHLTSSGTVANLEALWVAGRLAPGRRILASEQAHYTHQRISGVLQLPFAAVPADHAGRLRLDALEDELRKGDVGTVVVTLGTTAIGAVDPLPQILELRSRYGFRIHVDAAYGGYFRLIPEALEDPARRAFALLDQVDSLVVDPHKHGLQPYGCGCVLFRDPAIGRLYKHDSPYTYFSSKELHLGEISLECSRAGAAAVALWATHQLLPLVPGGEFAQGLALGRAAALELDRRLRADARIEPLAAGPPELDIVVWKLAAANPNEASRQAQSLFLACAARDLHLALVQLPLSWFHSAEGVLPVQTGYVTCMRSVLMKPEHKDWLNTMWDKWIAACAEVVGGLS